MPKVINGSVVLDEDEIQAIIKVNKFFELFTKIDELVKSMTDKEFKMLENSLEFTVKEMKGNG